jgi:hypothetical protein
MTPMMRKVSLVVGACVVLLVLAKLLGLFSLRRAQTNPPPIPSTLQTTWTIKFHTDSGSVKYDLVDATPDKDHGGCQYATTPSTTLDAKNLIVCQNDVILWQATTSEQKQQHDLIVFMADQILRDKGSPGTATTTFLGKDGNPTTPPGLVVAPDYNPHEWYVVVIDRQNPSGSAHDEPKIKVGG